jgi:serine protease inhibitor
VIGCGLAMATGCRNESPSSVLETDGTTSGASEGGPTSGTPGADGGTSGENTDGTAGSTTLDGSTTDGTTTTDGETTGGDDPLQVCRELPEAELAQWVEGPEVESIAESTPERIEAMGAHSWSIALRLLELTDPAKRPSVASSPASLMIALGMSYGDSGCGEQILDVVEYPEEGEDLHHTLGASIQELESRALPARMEEDAVVLSLRSSRWGFPMAPIPEDGLIPEEPNFYGATSNLMYGDLDAARTIMNCVIEVESQGLLQDFIPIGLPAPDTGSFDINVAYLQAPWDVGLSSLGASDFTQDTGDVVSLPMMGTGPEGPINASHYESAGLFALDIPLRGNALSVLFVAPKVGEYADLEAFTLALEPHDLAEIRAQSVQGLAELRMPKVDIESMTLDYYDPFGFECPIYTMRTVLHGAAVQMDEKGIKAAAATVNEIWVTGGEAEPDFDVVLDRPFLFFIYDRDTEFVLYSGRFAG